MKARRRRSGSRRHRGRPTPKWLLSSEQIDQLAKARCLMLLRVLSGETPVSDAISEAGISRGTYYQLETRALNAMLRAVGPLGVEEGGQETGALKRIAELEAKLKKLERSRRRADRLLLMTRRVVKGGLTLRARRTSSTGTGRNPSPSSGKNEKGPKASTPGPIGVAVP